MRKFSLVLAIVCSGIVVTAADQIINRVTGTDRPEWLGGTDGDDRIEALRGRDYVYGFGGNDIILGDNGQDLLDGGTGNDVIYGGFDKDVMYGGSGDDVMVGGSSNDRLHGGPGDDRIYGDSTGNFDVNSPGFRYTPIPGDDDLYGDSGNDLLSGRRGNDILYGGGGRDSLYGDQDNDQLFGGFGNDDLYGGAGSDFLVGEGGSDRMFGGHGNDVLLGLIGFDLLDAGPGADDLFGGLGRDRFIGGSGRDDYWGDINSTEELFEYEIIPERVGFIQKDVDTLIYSNLRSSDLDVKATGPAAFEITLADANGAIITERAFGIDLVQTSDGIFDIYDLANQPQPMNRPPQATSRTVAFRVVFNQSSQRWTLGSNNGLEFRTNYLFTATSHFQPGLGPVTEDTDEDGDSLVLRSVTQPQRSSVAFGHEYGSRNTILWRNRAYPPGTTDSFTYTIQDGRGGVSTATINIVFEVNEDLSVDYPEIR